MSKAVTNEEVEDVLSSIRRLVSEDKRPLAGLSNVPREPAAAPIEEAEMPSDRLVLTPALRVTDAPKAVTDTDPLDLGAVARETWTPSKEAMDTKDETAPMMLFPADAEDDIDTLVQGTLETQGNDDADDLAGDDYSSEGYWDDYEVDDVKETAIENHRAIRVDDVTLDVEIVQAAPVDNIDWKDEVSDADEKWEVEPATDGIAAEEGLLYDLEPMVEPTSVEQDANFLTADVPLTAKIAALGAAIGKSPQDWEPDGDEANELTAQGTPAMAWEDDVELDAKGSPLEAEFVEVTLEDEAENTAEQPVEAEAGGDDQLMDEETLRDLVSEIVRAELQGALGERITRNVRKLVRREIHRALTAQEME